jgi:hypothetical protein
VCFYLFARAESVSSAYVAIFPRVLKMTIENASRGISAEEVALALGRAGEDVTSARVALVADVLESGAVRAPDGADAGAAVARARHYLDEVVPNLEPQHIPLMVFHHLVEHTLLDAPGRGSAIRFRGQQIGLSYDKGRADVVDAHRRIVNNALYWNSESESNPNRVGLPSPAALYPALREKFPGGTQLAEGHYREGRIHPSVNERANGIFADGYVDRNGLPVGDTFAYMLRAAVHGPAARDWSKERLTQWIGSFSTNEMLMMMDGRAEQRVRADMQASSKLDGKTPGQRTYERDVERQPLYEHGGRRPGWKDLRSWEQLSWERYPFDRVLGRGDAARLNEALPPFASDFGPVNKYGEPVRSSLALFLPQTVFRPEPMRVSLRETHDWHWYEVETYAQHTGEDGHWIAQKTHGDEAAAVADAKGWYPEPEGDTLRAHALRQAPTGYRLAESDPGDAEEIVFEHADSGDRIRLKQVEAVVGRRVIKSVNSYVNADTGDRYSVSAPLTDERPMEKVVRICLASALDDIDMQHKQQARLAKKEAEASLGM